MFWQRFAATQLLLVVSIDGKSRVFRRRDAAFQSPRVYQNNS